MREGYNGYDLVIQLKKEKGSNQGIKENEHRHVETFHRWHSRKRFDRNIHKGLKGIKIQNEDVLKKSQ